jgi:hypothetical protein
VGFDIKDELLIRFFLHSPDTGKEKWEYSETVHKLLIHFKRPFDSVKREVLYSIPIEFEVAMKLVRLIKMCLNETCSKVRIGKHLRDTFPIQNSRKQRCFIAIAFQLCFRIVLPKLCSIATQFLERQSVATHIALLDKKK